MFLVRPLAVFFCASCLFAQSVSDLSRAQAQVDRLKELAAAGAIAPARVQEAEAALGDARDNGILQRTVFGRITAQDLTEDQSREMIAAAQRRYDRQLAKLDQARKLVDAGVIARDDLRALEDELGSRKLTLDLANFRAKLIDEIIASAQRETELEPSVKAATPSPDNGGVMVHFEGDGQISTAEIRRIQVAYESQFHSALPISAYGETGAHRALGFDHRGRVDVAVNPDQAEGLWLRAYLEKNNIPYYAFRAAIRGKATGAHIHIGPGSARLRAAD